VPFAVPSHCTSSVNKVMDMRMRPTTEVRKATNTARKRNILALGYAATEKFGSCGLVHCTYTHSENDTENAVQERLMSPMKPLAAENTVENDMAVVLKLSTNLA
jgi:hypothetical protein